LVETGRFEIGSLDINLSAGVFFFVKLKKVRTFLPLSGI